MVSFLISFLILVIVLGLVWWVLTMIPLPQPFLKIAQIVLAVVLILALLGMLTGNIPPFKIGV